MKGPKKLDRPAQVVQPRGKERMRKCSLLRRDRSRTQSFELLMERPCAKALARLDFPLEPLRSRHAMKRDDVKGALFWRLVAANVLPVVTRICE